MKIFEALNEIRRGKIARCKHSYFMLDEDGCLIRIFKDGSVKGIATITGDMFATEDWEVMTKSDLTKEKIKWTMS